MKVFVITGCTTKDNLGYKIAKAIKEKISDSCIIGIRGPDFGTYTNFSIFDYSYRVDLSDGDSVNDLLASIKMNSHILEFGLYSFINAAGYNRLQWFDENFDWHIHEKIMNINFKSPCQLIAGLTPELTLAEGAVLNIISMGAVKPFRTSFSYNTSKAALKMATHQLARELASKKITVFGISPNELDGTNMTEEIRNQVEKLRGWSAEQAEQYRLAGALSPKLTSPDILADFIVNIIQSKDHHHHFTGCDIQYGT